MDITNSSRTISGQGALFPLLGAELLDAVFELRFMIMAMIVLTLADLWWATRELKYHRENALAIGDTETAEKYRYHKSRAGRRTMNKIIDYMTYLLVGAFIGYAITEPLGMVGHVTTAAIGIGLGCMFDISSIIGHILAIHGMKWNGRRMMMALLKKKHPELGDALSEAIEDKSVKPCTNCRDKEKGDPAVSQG